MKFMVSIETPGKGNFDLGYVDGNNQLQATNEVVKMLVACQIPREKIGMSVPDNSSLFVKGRTIHIQHIPEFTIKKAFAITALI